MPSEEQHLEAAISTLESQRAVLGDEVVDAAVAPLRARLVALCADGSGDAMGQTLKHVTILFLDVVGSTRLSEHLDPEDIFQVMDGALTRLARIVETFGGKVLKYVGDALLAVFGIDGAREDDPERAVRCGLALLVEGRALSEEILEVHDHHGFDVRVGVHTGGVLLGGGVDAGNSIHGVAVNIAARMEQSAPPGALRISHDTYREVRGVFDVEPQAPIALKGLGEPLDTYLVERARPRAFRKAMRGIEGVETRMVGREDELAILQDAFMRLHSEPGLAAVTVVAEAGVGKSRLLYEFDNWADTRPERFLLFQGRATPNAQSQPYRLLADLLTWRFEIADDDAMDVARAKFEDNVAPLFVASDGEDLAISHAHVLGHLIGLDFSDSPHVKDIAGDPGQIRSRSGHVAAQIFRRLVAREGAPIVLQLDDLHWADDASIEFLGRLAVANRDVPMLILGMTRPALFERPTVWLDHVDAHRRVDLRSLSDVSRRALATELLKRLPEVPDALRDLVGSADGNPFYMEEIVKMLIDQGAIEVHPESWTLDPRKLSATQVPPSLVGVLHARLDLLTRAERRTLQAASVIGPVFWDKALAALDPDASETLPWLVKRGLTVPHPESPLEGLREYAFQHQILHRVTYDTVLRQERRELHGKTAAWLAELTGARSRDFLSATADHYEKAGDPLNACEYLARCAEYSMQRFAHSESIAHVQHGLALLDEEPEPKGRDLRWRLWVVGERTLGLLGRRDEQRSMIDSMCEAVALGDDLERRAEAIRRSAVLAERTGDYETAVRLQQEALAVATLAGDEVKALEIQAALSWVLSEMGAPEAGPMAEAALVTARTKALRRIEALLLETLANIASNQSDPERVLALDEQTLEIWEEIDDGREKAKHLCNIGESFLDVGDLVSARRFLDAGLQLRREVGDRAAEPWPLINLSHLERWQGNAEPAEAFARQALEIATEVGSVQQAFEALLALARNAIARGDLSLAADSLERAAPMAEGRGPRPGRVMAACLAELALAHGDVAAALVHVEALLPALADTRAGPQLGLAPICFRTLALAGDSRASDVLVKAQRDLHEIATSISDPSTRASFLDNVPEHRDIVTAYYP